MRLGAVNHRRHAEMFAVVFKISIVRHFATNSFGGIINFFTSKEVFRMRSFDLGLFVSSNPSRGLR